MEVGYSQTYTSLIEDMKLLLKGSEGRIGFVIIVKITPLKANETEVQKGFIQVYKYDPATERTIKHGGRMVRSPLLLSLLNN